MAGIRKSNNRRNGKPISHIYAAQSAFCHLNSREDFIAIRRFFENERFDDKYLTEELKLTDLIFPPPEAKELKEIRTRIPL